MVDSKDDLRTKYSQRFVEFLASERAQLQVLKGGLFSTAKGINIADDSGVMKDITPNKIEDYEMFNVFLSKTEIEKLQQKLLL